jgi:hypothetical protein
MGMPDPRTSSRALLCRPFRAGFGLLRRTQGFVLGFAVAPFQGWIRVAVSDPGFRPGLGCAALSGLGLVATPYPGLRPGLCCGALSGLDSGCCVRPRTSSWAWLCRPFRADLWISPLARVFARHGVFAFANVCHRIAGSGYSGPEGAKQQSPGWRSPR